MTNLDDNVFSPTKKPLLTWIHDDDYIYIIEFLLGYGTTIIRCIERDSEDGKEFWKDQYGYIGFQIGSNDVQDILRKWSSQETNSIT